MTNRERLGEFLRLKRNSIAPESLGLPKPQRSRTPGLRREDVAELALISTVWYAKLERGKADRVSRQVLIAIARAMNCDDSETRYLLQLAGHRDLPDKSHSCEKLSGVTQRLLAALDPFPAMLCNDFKDILQVNGAFARMVGFDVNRLDQSQRNSIVLMENNQQWQQWLGVSGPADLTVCMQNAAAQVRAAMVSRACDLEWQNRLDQLMADCPLFREIWSNHRVRAREQIERDYQHAELGIIRLSKQFWSNSGGDISGQLMVFLPEHCITVTGQRLPVCTMARLIGRACTMSDWHRHFQSCNPSIP